MPSNHFARAGTGPPQTACKHRLPLCFVSVLLVLLTGCRPESVEERAYGLLTATLEKGGAEIRQRNRVHLMRITYAVMAQGNRSADSAEAAYAENISQRTDSVLDSLDAMARPLPSEPGGAAAVRAYLPGDEGAGPEKLHALYHGLAGYRQYLSKTPGIRDLPGLALPRSSGPAHVPFDTLQAFLRPFRDATAPEARAVLAAYKAHVLLLEEQALELISARLGAYSIRDYFSIPLIVNPRWNEVRIGSHYEAELYVSAGLSNWTHYKTLLNGKRLNTRAPYAILTAPGHVQARRGQWEARLYLFDASAKDTVLTIRRPFRVFARGLVNPQKP